jgi:AraC-like DNA-binding protein
MPILDAAMRAANPMDPDDVPRPLVVFGTSGIDVRGPSRREIDFHSHRKGQLLLLMRGALECEVAGSLWIVPPQGALWVPGGVVHRIAAAGAMHGYVAFVEPAVAARLPRDCCAVSATPLLRELMARAAQFALLYPEGGMEARLVTLLLDELALAPTGQLHLPMPADARLRKIVDAILADPADRGTVQAWAQRVGLSERTLARLLATETGMSFGRWRQQLHLMLAVKWLSTGTSVQQVSNDLGYESAGSFVVMFRRAIGTSPGRYMAQRRLPDK